MVEHAGGEDVLRFEPMCETRPSCWLSVNSSLILGVPVTRAFDALPLLHIVHSFDTALKSKDTPVNVNVGKR